MEPHQTIPYLLLVDDDRELCVMLVRYLTTEGFRCQVAHDGEHALALIQAEKFNALILDVMLPRMNGIEVLKGLRVRSNNTPVLMLTARGDDVNSILGLESGADDYLTKPCNPKVLVARLRAVLRRSLMPIAVDNGLASMHVEKLTLHPGARIVTLDGVPLDLTSAEYKLLHVLLLETGQPVSKEILCQKGLGRKLTSYDRSVDIHISNLRRKLGNLNNGDPRIVTVRGVGYLYAIPRET